MCLGEGPQPIRTEDPLISPQKFGVIFILQDSSMSLKNDLEVRVLLTEQVKIDL
tara:strand:+ start:70 stop:231 length:162 start_codon:yes stop_codon:yes gene_type:complete